MSADVENGLVTSYLLYASLNVICHMQISLVVSIMVKIAVMYAIIGLIGIGGARAERHPASIH